MSAGARRPSRRGIFHRPWGGVEVGKFLLAAVIGVALATAEKALAADDVMLTKAAPASSNGWAADNWTGFYVGGHMGVAWGSSNWTATPGISGSTDLFQTIDTFDEAGSFFAGVQGGYNYMLPNRFVVGAEVDASFPSFQNVSGISIGGTSTFLFADAWPGKLRRDGAGFRYGARPRRLCARPLVVLCDGRIRLDL